MKARRTLLATATVVTVSVSAVAGLAGFSTAAYDASVDKVYDIPLEPVSRSSDPAVLARGEHVVDAIAGCSSASCHGADLGGGETVRPRRKRARLPVVRASRAHSGRHCGGFDCLLLSHFQP
jgi:hypothetical protein